MMQKETEYRDFKLFGKFSFQFSLKFSRPNDSFCITQANKDLSEEKETKVQEKQKGGKQDLRKSVRQKAVTEGMICSLGLLPTETLYHLFSFLQVNADHNLFCNLKFSNCKFVPFSTLHVLQPIDLRAVAQTCSRFSEVGMLKPYFLPSRLLINMINNSIMFHSSLPLCFQVCESLLPSRGCVTLVWERRRGVGQRRMRYNWVEVQNLGDDHDDLGDHGLKKGVGQRRMRFNWVEV